VRHESKGILIESLLLAEVFSPICNDYPDFFLHHTDHTDFSSWIAHYVPVPYYLLSYDLLLDFFSIPLQISSVSDHHWIIRSFYYAVRFLSNWLFYFDILSVSTQVGMFRLCHGLL